MHILKEETPGCTIAMIHEYAKWTYNVHNIEHRNLEIRKTLATSLFRYETFYYLLSLKVLRHKERDTHSFYSGFFICTPPPFVRHLPKASASKRKATLLVRCPVLNSTNFLQIPKILRALPVRDVIAFVSSVSHLGLL